MHRYPLEQSIDQPVGQVKAERRETIVKVFRIILYCAKNNRPLSDVGPLREMQARNGLVDLDVGEGVLKDHSGKYTSRTFLREAVSSIAEVLRLEFAEALAASSAVSVIVDATMGVDGNDHLIVFLRLLDKEGSPVTKFAALIETKKDEQRVIDFAENVCNDPIDPERYKIAYKGGLNIHLHQAPTHWRRRPRNGMLSVWTAFCKDPVLSHVQKSALLNAPGLPGFPSSILASTPEATLRYQAAPSSDLCATGSSLRMSSSKDPWSA